MRHQTVTSKQGHAKPRPSPSYHAPLNHAPRSMSPSRRAQPYTYTMDEADGVYACAVGTSYNETLCGCDEDATNPR